jgi:ABC-type nitrate/sulfonate/bicarbonate transport system ATPase subunit
METALEKTPKDVVSNLTKQFGDLLVLDEVSFQVGEGEFLAIVGPTGCGKTTFLNTLSKLIPATRGHIRINGEEADPKKHNLVPFGQLDAQTRYFMEKETVRIWETEKRTVLFVTNNIDEAIYLGDRIITLEGKLPGRKKSTYPIHLPRPREHTDAAFLQLRHQIIQETQLLL